MKYFSILALKICPLKGKDTGINNPESKYSFLTVFLPAGNWIAKCDYACL